jgi:hypothetical protein
MKHYPASRNAAGFALVTALVFLVILTLVAVVAIRSSGLELKMGANATMRAQALQASELARTLITGGPTTANTGTTGGLLAAHLYWGGEWPAAAGGTVPDTIFNYTIPSKLTLRDSTSTGPYTYSNSSSGSPASWLTNTESSFPCITQLSINATSTTTCPSTFPSGTPQMVVDAVYHDTTTAPYVDIYATTAVIWLRAAPAPGQGEAMLQATEGWGQSAAIGGTNVFFYLLTRGQDQSSSPQARYDTSAQYRYVPR